MKILENSDDKQQKQSSYYQIDKKLYLLLQIGKILMESGADTNRIVRNMKRVGIYMNIPENRLHIHITFTTIMINVDDGSHSITKFRKCTKHGIDMTAISAISKLSWRAIEKNYTLVEFERQLSFICQRPRYYKPFIVAISAGFACGGFSLLFGCDILSFFYTSCCAMIGFITRIKCNKLNINPYACIAISSFIATCLAYLTHFLPTTTPWHALIACSLFIVPGIPLINAVDDLLDNFIISGMTRAINTLLMVASMTFGIVLAIKLCQVNDFITINIISTNSYLICIIASAIASIGFSTIFNTPPRLLYMVALGAIISVGTRNFFMFELSFDQPTASLIGAVVVSLLSLKTVHIVHTPNHVLTIPSVIPLIPGVFMYRLLFSIINIENIPADKYHLILENGVNTTLIILAIAVGVAIPNIFFRQYLNKSKKLRVYKLLKSRN